MCPPKKTLDSNSLNSVNCNYLQFIVSQLDIIWPSGIVNQTLIPPKKLVISRWFITTFLEYASESNQATDEGKDLKLLFFLIKNKNSRPVDNVPFNEVNVNWRRPIQKLLVRHSGGVANRWKSVKDLFFSSRKLRRSSNLPSILFNCVGKNCN